MNGRQRLLLIVILLVAILVGAAGAVAVMRTSDDDGGSKPSVRASSDARFEPDQTTVEDCKDAQLACLEQAMGNLAVEAGAKAALAELEQHVGTGDALDTQCHRLTHAVGNGTLYRKDGDVGAAFAEGDSTCASGYFHGVLEEAFAGVPKKRVSAVAVKLCSSEEVRATEFLHYQCVHGLGHGLMLHLNYELPASLRVCEAFKDSWESTSCDGGVFMENVSSLRGGRSKYLKEDDLVYPCNEVAERHKYYCYLMLTSRVGEAKGFDWKLIARVCREDAERDWRDECFQSFGRDASGQARRQVPPVVSTCELAGEGWVGECVYGAARDMVYEDAGPDRAARFCSLVRQAVQARCAGAMGTIIESLHPETRHVAECKRSLGAVGLARLVEACAARAGDTAALPVESAA